jgi:hypothetical protein
MQLNAIYRVTVFVPEPHLRVLIDGIKRVHPLGDDYYDSVLWYLEGAHEQFRPLPGARPRRGTIGALHEEQVSMLVFSLPRDEALLEHVLEEGVKANHPWEAPGVFVEASWTL